MQNQCERNMASSGAGRDERWILAGATALVTGRSKGIGRAIVEELVGFGSTVHTCARSEAELSRCQEELTAKGLAVSFSVCDVSVRTDREELVSRVRELFGGKLNILVNNAGLTLSKLTLETTTSDYTQQIVANFESCFHLSQLLHPLLKAFERGSIINISSISSYLAYPYLAVYSAAKGAMNQFSKALASDWAGDNIRINCVAPGLTRTPLLEEAFARFVVLFLCLKRRSGDFF
ncbi:tropinone reductase 1 isoform X3 [Oryza sativa Japonica Group]|uniref:tropinone reductase 1 isoform X3 n=2 Tax=Oryza sativa subsp. japonica TaxID=39947 RepID=UPI000E1B6B04|nr:tropinone reductase 1 isoform X3 [Oryza sativa Japonica Group]